MSREGGKGVRMWMFMWALWSQLGTEWGSERVGCEPRGEGTECRIRRGGFNLPKYERVGGASVLDREGRVMVSGILTLYVIASGRTRRGHCHRCCPSRRVGVNFAIVAEVHSWGLVRCSLELDMWAGK